MEVSRVGISNEISKCEGLEPWNHLAGTGDNYQKITIYL